jgi:tRNA dimethylallyltransferase
VAKDRLKPLLVIVGETASGKSSLALQLAQRFNGEIISADSASVHREADIGTAKPTAAEQSLLPHHLINVVGPNELFTAADFQRLSLKTIDEINNRNKLPIIVGGTGLYIDSLLYSYSFLPFQRQEELNSLSLQDLQNRAREIGSSLGNLDVHNKRC